MKKIILIIIILIISSYFFIEFVSDNLVKNILQKNISSSLNRDVSIKKLKSSKFTINPQSKKKSTIVQAITTFSRVTEYEQH